MVPYHYQYGGMVVPVVVPYHSDTLYQRTDPAEGAWNEIDPNMRSVGRARQICKPCLFRSFDKRYILFA